MRRKSFSDLVIIYLALYVSGLGYKGDFVTAIDNGKLQLAFEGKNSVVATESYSDTTSLVNGEGRNHPSLITVVGTVDGLLHGFDELNNKKWTTDVGGGPLSSHHSSGNLDYSVIPATDGSLLLHSGEGMRKTSVTARMLVEKAPFTTHDGLIFTSQKTSRVIGVDLGSGRVVHELLGSGGIMGIGLDDLKRTGRQGRGATYDRAIGGEGSYRGERGGGNSRKSHRSPFWLGRTDYTLRAFDQMTGAEEFNFTYSELRPLHKGAVHLPQDGRSGSSSNSRIGTAQGQGQGGGQRGDSVGQIQDPRDSQPLPLPLISTPEGELYFTDQNGQIRRTYALEYPAVSAFTVEDLGDRSTGSAVRTQSGYSVQSLRLAYRMPSAACDEYGGEGEGEGEGEGDSSRGSSGDGDTSSTDVRRRKKRRKCLPGGDRRGGQGSNRDISSSSPSSTNTIIVRSLNDGGLYALEMTDGGGGGAGKAPPSSSSSAVATTGSSSSSSGVLAISDSGPKAIKGVTSSAALSPPFPPLPPPPLPPLPDDTTASKSDKEKGTKGRDRSGPSDPNRHVADTSLLLKTFDRLVRGQAGGMGMGVGMGMGLGIKSPSVGSIGLSTRMGACASTKMGAGSVPGEEGQTLGQSDVGSGTGVGVGVGAVPGTGIGSGSSSGIAGSESDTVKDKGLPRAEAVKSPSKLLGNHFVLQHRPGPVKKDLTRTSDALVTSHTKGSRHTAFSRWFFPADRERDRERERERDLVFGDVKSGADIDSDGDGEEAEDKVLSFVDYLLEYRDQGEKKWSRGLESTVDTHGPEREGESKGDSRGFRAPRSFFSVVTYYLHVVEMLMLRLLVFTFFLYLSLYWLRNRGLTLPPPLGTVSDSLISLLERLVVRPELLIMRTKSFMNLEGAGSGGRGIGNLQSIVPAAVEEPDLDLIEGGYTSRVGSLLLTSDVLGYGSHGTVVLRGSLNGRPVAVKRMLSRFNRAADREVSLLIRSDGHPNVVRYFLRETKNEFVYLALQLCNMSLR